MYIACEQNLKFAVRERIKISSTKWFRPVTTPSG